MRSEPKGPPRYLLREIATLHRLNPNDHEIITEGHSDACIVRWFVEACGIDAEVFEIRARVEVDGSLVTGLGLPIGERSRLIAAAKWFESNEKLSPDSILFLIDGDYNYTLSPPVPEAPNLLVTDYADLESYCFDPKILGKYLSVVLRVSSIEASDVLDAITDALMDLFAIRWLLSKLPGSPKLISRISNKVSLLAGRLTVDSMAILQASVRSSSDPSVHGMKEPELREMFEMTRRKLDEAADRRYCINGHDYPEFLNYYLKLKYPSFFNNDRQGFDRPAVALRSIVGCLDLEYLSEIRLFAEMKQRVLAH